MDKYIVELIKEEINNCVSVEEITNVVNKYQIEKDVNYEFDDQGNLMVSNTGFDAIDIHNSCDSIEVKIANTMNDLQRILHLDNPIKLEVYSLYALNYQLENGLDYNEAIKHVCEVYDVHQKDYMLDSEIINDLEMDIFR